MNVIKKLLSLFNVVAFICFGLSFLAYQNMQKAPPVPELPPLKLSEKSLVELKIFYSDIDVEKMRALVRKIQVESKDKVRLAQAAANIWAQGSGVKGGGVLDAVPKGSKTPQVYLRGDHYIVNLPAKYAKLGYGSSAERMMICTLTRTLLEIAGKDVYYLVNSQSVDVLRHIDLREPFTRQDCAS